MMKKFSISFRSFLFSISIFLLTGTAIGKGSIITGTVFNFFTISEWSTLVCNAKVLVTNSTNCVISSSSMDRLQKQSTLAFSDVDGRQFKMPLVANLSTNILPDVSFILNNDMAAIVTLSFSNQSI